MRIPALLIKSTSALLLLSSLALTSAHFGEPSRVNQRRPEFKVVKGDDGVRYRSPQALYEEAQQQAHRPYDYGFGPDPDDADSTAVEADGPSLTNEGECILLGVLS